MSLVCLDAHLYRAGWRWENLELPTGQGTLTALRNRERGGGGEGDGKGSREKLEILNK